MHRWEVCEEGYTIIRCRCPGGITAVKPCPEGHAHRGPRVDPKTGQVVVDRVIEPPLPDGSEGA